MATLDPSLTQIARTLDVEKSRGGYTLRNRFNGNPIARLRPVPDTDGFELFYWSDFRGKWRSFAPLGSMRLSLDEISDIIDQDPLFQSLRSR